MAVEVFKDGSSQLVEPDFLASFLEDGWSVEDPDGVIEPAPAPTIQAVVPGAPVLEIIDDPSANPMRTQSGNHVMPPPIAVVAPAAPEAPRQKRKYTKRAS